MALLIYSLAAHSHESRLINDNSTLKKEATETEKKNNVIFELKDKKISDLVIKESEFENIVHKQQEQISKQECKLGLFSKYMFDPRMSFFRLGDKGYCAICLFNFHEVQIGVQGNQFKCPSCGIDYSRTAGMIVIDEYYKPTDDRR